MALPSDNAKHRVIRLKSRLNNLIRNLKKNILHNKGAAGMEDGDKALRISITRSLVRE